MQPRCALIPCLLHFYHTLDALPLYNQFCHCFISLQMPNGTLFFIFRHFRLGFRIVDAVQRTLYTTYPAAIRTGTTRNTVDC